VERINGEAVLRHHRFREIREQFGRDGLGRPTAFTDEVRVGVRCEVVGRSTVAEVGVHQHAEALEFLQVSVDGRTVDGWVRSVNCRSELISSAVTVRLDHGFDDGSPRGGHPRATLTDVLEHAVDRRCLVRT